MMDDWFDCGGFSFLLKKALLYTHETTRFEKAKAWIGMFYN